VHRKIGSSLEAEVELLIPDMEESSSFLALLQREGSYLLYLGYLLLIIHTVEDFLKTFFITSDAMLIDEGSLGTDSPEWVYHADFAIPCA
jgi:isoleucyl-tRNA synthetase